MRNGNNDFTDWNPEPPHLAPEIRSKNIAPAPLAVAWDREERTRVRARAIILWLTGSLIAGLFTYWILHS